MDVTPDKRDRVMHELTRFLHTLLAGIGKNLLQVPAAWSSLGLNTCC